MRRRQSGTAAVLLVWGSAVATAGGCSTNADAPQPTGSGAITFVLEGPAAGSTVSGPIRIEAKLQGSVPSPNVDFDIDGVLEATDRSAPFCLAGDDGVGGACRAFDTSTLKPGLHAFRAVLTAPGVRLESSLQLTVAGAASISDAGPASTSDAGPTPIPDAGPTPVVRAGPGIRPDATNTGVPPGTSLTVVDGDMTVTQDDTVVDATEIRGLLTIKASRVHVTRSLVHGRPLSSGVGAAIHVQSGTAVLLEDTEVAVTTPYVGLDGVSGSNFTARRLNIHGGVDGMKLGDNDVVEYSYIHDMTYFASDPSQGGGPTHNDAIQILSGQSIRVTGNNLVAARSDNSAIQVTQDFGAVTDLEIEKNWGDGGGCTFNFAHKVLSSLTLTASDNRFGRNSSFTCPILTSTQTTLLGSGNVWDDTGAAVPVQSHD